MGRESTVAMIVVPSRQGKSPEEFLAELENFARVCVKAISELREDVGELQAKLKKDGR